MNGRSPWLARITAGVLIALTGIVAQPQAGRAQSGQVHAKGCHAWAPVFRPVLSILGAGKLLVALPTHVPHFSHRVYAHANVLVPPLTYDVVLSTQPGNNWPVARRTVLLAVHGVVGLLPPPPGSTTRMAGRKTVAAATGLFRTRSATWQDRHANVTYTVTLPARLGLRPLLRVTASLLPAALRQTPITAAPTHFNACP